MGSRTHEQCLLAGHLKYFHKISKPRYSDLSTDILPRHVQHGPVVDDEVPESPALDPGAHRGVVQSLLEHHLVPPALRGDTPDPGVLVDPGVEEEDLGLVEVLPVGRHLVVEVEAVLVLRRTSGLREPVGLQLAVVVLHEEPGHGVVGAGGVVLVDAVVGNVGTPGLQHPEVSVVHLPALALVLPCKDIIDDGNDIDINNDNDIDNNIDIDVDNDIDIELGLDNDNDIDIAIDIDNDIHIDIDNDIYIDIDNDIDIDIDSDAHRV